MLFSHGWKVDDILDLSIDQIGLVIECTLSYKSEVAGYVMDVVSSALGGKVKNKNKRNRKNKKSDPNNISMANDGIDAVSRKLASMGVNIQTKSEG